MCDRLCNEEKIFCANSWYFLVIVINTPSQFEKYRVFCIKQNTRFTFKHDFCSLFMVFVLLSFSVFFERERNIYVKKIFSFSIIRINRCWNNSCKNQVFTCIIWNVIWDCLGYFSLLLGKVKYCKPRPWWSSVFSQMRLCRIWYNF